MKPWLHTTDFLGTKILLERPPRRIVSLVPSLSSLVCALGMEQQLVGITKFCTLPPSSFRQKTKIGGTKNVHLDRVIELKPDLILANKEENIQDQIDFLRDKAKVYVTEIKTLDDNDLLIARMGELLGRVQEANAMIKSQQESWQELHIDRRYKVAYLIWKDPFMTIGADTFINDVLKTGGLDNVYGDQIRYPSTSLSELKDRGPEVILLSSEPYPFAQKHLEEIEKLTGIRCMLVDGVPFSWYGDQVLHSASYLSRVRDKLKGI